MWIATIYKKENLERFAKAGIHAVILGMEGLSIRQTVSISIQEILEWKRSCQKLGVKLYLNCLAFCMEEDLSYAEKVLLACKQADVDGIYFADEGLLYLAKEIGIEDRMIYQPETLVVNHQDVMFYLEQGVQAVSLAHELSLEEITSIAKSSSQIEILAHGYHSILYSRRLLVSNYLEVIGSQEDPKQRYDLIEQTREDRMPILEDNKGTHVFSPYPICSQKQMEHLMGAGIQRFRIDSLFFDDEWTLRVLDAYQHGSTLSDESKDTWYHQQSTHIKEKENV